MVCLSAYYFQCYCSFYYIVTYFLPTFATSVVIIGDKKRLCGLFCKAFKRELCCHVFKSVELMMTLILTLTLTLSFYRAMHFSAKRGIAIACRLSVCLSVCL